jgi:hypothetical protein
MVARQPLALLNVSGSDVSLLFAEPQSHSLIIIIIITCTSHVNLHRLHPLRWELD